MNQSDTFPHELEERLQALADDVHAPGVPLGDDLARGRSARRRYRLATAGGALAVVAVVGLGAGGVGQLAGDGTSSLAPAGGSGAGVDPAPSVSPTPSTVPESKTTSAVPQMDAAAARDRRIQTKEYAAVLEGYNDVLAEHLDPQRAHLQPYTLKTGNVQFSGDGSGTVSALGSKFAWTNAGEEGMGMLQVSVGTGWSSLFWDCASTGWTCGDAVGPADEKARVAEHDGVQEVAVRHADGHVVALTFDVLFGNNSVVPISGADVTQEQLIAAAADERLVLPAVE